MTEAVGIHAHPTKKLGRRPASGKPALNLAEFLQLDQLPAHPLTDPVPPLAYPMDRNDVAGDCVVAGLDHALQTIHAGLGVPRANWTDAELLAFYQTQNSGFRSWADGGGPNDRGMVIQEFLSYLQGHAGVISGFAKLDPANEELIKAATWLGLAVVTGEDLRVAQQGQAVWDYVPGSADWGGHCTCMVSYAGSPDTDGYVTWGQVVQVTETFVQRQVSEAWFILTPAHIANPTFRDNFDLAGFAAAVREITGGKIVVPVTPPTPAPPPGPMPPFPPSPLPEVLADFPFDTLNGWAAKPHSFNASRVAAQKYRTWKNAHGL